MNLDNSFFSADHNEYMQTSLGSAGRGVLRIMLLFGSTAMALGLIVVPVLNDQANRVAAQSVLPDNIDRTMTGSIKRDADKPAQPAVVRHESALQPDTDPVCVIEVNGSHHGGC
ncbi:MAG: hypothetical protein J0H18_12475 [Rhizobiales bacterium]|nr:hypothetical protein [Hyphomicrobiales bacterium]OJY07110.1 MAG: hypothetical protein BGP07_19250 [Rhizobiales bacterium 63-22]